MVKLKTGKYKRSYFSGGSNNNFNLRMCEDNIDILTTLQNTYLIDNIHISLNLYAPDN